MNSRRDFDGLDCVEGEEKAVGEKPGGKFAKR